MISVRGNRFVVCVDCLQCAAAPFPEQRAAKEIAVLKMELSGGIMNG